MPPQQDETGNIDVGNDLGKKQSGAMSTEEKAAKDAATSYWEAPEESKLKGKTLSTMNVSELEHERIEESTKGGSEKSEMEAEATNNTKKNENGGGYWEWQENIRKSISKLTLTDLFYQSSKQTASAESKLKTEGRVESEKDESPENEENTANVNVGDSSSNFWMWRNASLKNLRWSTASLTSLENAARAADGSSATATDSTEGTAAPPSSSSEKPRSYWFWRNASLSNMSSASLDTMEKTARETDRMEGKNNDVETSTGPITNLSHKLRSSWRKSFQHLSTNSLSRLSEDNNNVALESQDFKKALGRKSSMGESFREDDESVGSQGALEF